MADGVYDSQDGEEMLNFIDILGQVLKVLVFGSGCLRRIT